MKQLKRYEKQETYQTLKNFQYRNVEIKKKESFILNTRETTQNLNPKKKFESKEYKFDWKTETHNNNNNNQKKKFTEKW